MQHPRSGYDDFACIPRTRKWSRGNPTLDDERWQSAEQISSKIGSPEFIRVFSFPLIRPHGGYVDCIPMVIKGAKYARLVASHVRLQSLKGLFSYKERPLHRTVMPPKPNGTSSWIKNSALIREIEHGSLRFQSVSIFGILDIRGPLPRWQVPRVVA